jgi:NMD protein affecting ribosome stability and mRNA decay
MVEPTSRTQTCVRCGETKPATTEHFVRNRPARRDRPDPPGRERYHKTCKACESIAKREGWARRQEQMAAAAAWAAKEAAERSMRIARAKIERREFEK